MSKKNKKSRQAKDLKLKKNNKKVQKAKQSGGSIVDSVIAHYLKLRKKFQEKAKNSPPIFFSINKAIHYA